MTLTKVFNASYHEGVTYPSQYPAINYEWFYFLVLRNRFERNLFSGYEEMIYRSMSHCLENSVAACNICGYYALGNMCNRTDMVAPTYLQLDPVYLNKRGELKKCLASYSIDISHISLRPKLLHRFLESACQFSLPFSISFKNVYG